MGGGGHENGARALLQKYLVGEALAEAPFVVLVADDEMRLTAASDAACELLGWEREELLRLRVTDIVVEQEAATLYSDFVAAGVQRGRITLRCKDGELVEASYEAHETRMSGLPYYVSVLFPS
jgi:PAS domain S-box-containing protein